MFSGLAPARRRLVVAVLAVVAVAVVWIAVALITDREHPQNDQNRIGPVLLVPGYGGSAASLQPLASALRTSGRDVTVVELPGDGTGDMNAMADVLATTAQAAMSRTGEPTVDVVGYSAGGVVARLWVADGGDDVVRRVVTLGSPHHGTQVANLAGQVAGSACADACRQLATGSDLLDRLNADETPGGPTWVSIWTTQDETVTPPDSARLDGALNFPVQSICANTTVSHGDLPRNAVVQAMVEVELAAGEPLQLTDADCARLRQG